jgi:NADPH:quinone reductase-like Zn-dependent oxidoreductase
MKAAIHVKYEKPDMLAIRDIEAPVPKHNEVLIRVHASTANRTDFHLLTGTPLVMRLFTGLLKPKNRVSGTDFAGQVEAIGQTVKAFKVGDRVMGFGGAFGGGSHAQYKTVREDSGVVLMPDNMSYVEAAACVEGTFYAAAGINELTPAAGQNSVVYGATGAIGSAVVQILKYYGVDVTAVCGGENRELVRSLGANKIFDYKTEDFTQDEERYDFVFDCVGKTSFLASRKLLKKNGIFLSADGLINVPLFLITPLFGGKTVHPWVPKDIRGNLNFIADLVAKGKFKPLIDRKYPLEKIGEAFVYVASRQKIGNVVIELN